MGIIAEIVNEPIGIRKRFFAIDKVFYQDNEVGEIVRNYLITSAKTNIVSLK